MANFCTDADLLRYEPNVFADVALPGQQKLHLTDAAITGTSVTSTTGGFDALQADEVCLIASNAGNAAGFAIASIESDQALTLSQPVTHLDATTGLTLMARSFEPQIRIIHEALMRRILHDPTQWMNPESLVLNAAVMVELEALGALDLVYALAGRVGGDATLAQRAEVFRRRYAAALAVAVIDLDEDGDGEADRSVYLAAGHMVRV